MRSQTADFAAWTAETYSASAVDKEIEVCFRELQAKHPPLNMNAYPEIDFRESGSFAKSALQ